MSTLKQYDINKIFLISVLALFTSGLSFALRGSVAGDIQSLYLDSIDMTNSAMMIGEILGVAFLGFAITLFIGSPILNIIGIGRMLALAAFCFISGTLIVVFADLISTGASIYWTFWIGMGLTGVGWGCTECAINPLTATIYPTEKTHRLNILHAWWPAGIVVGGLAGLGLGALGLSWQAKFFIGLIPAIVFSYLLLGLRFPPTERAAAGVGFGEMMSELIMRAIFLIWFGALFLSASTELAPGQWVDITLSHTVGMPGIVILIYVSALMFVMRHFAGPLVHRLSNTGLLLCSCVFAALGLYLLSIAQSPFIAFLASTVWGVGVCFLWPTMLASTSEKFPRGGEWFMGLIGSAGALSIYFVLPKLGAIFDQEKLQVAGGAEAFAALEGSLREAAIASAAQVSFQSAAIFPLILIVVFSVLLLLDRVRRVKSKAPSVAIPKI